MIRGEQTNQPSLFVVTIPAVGHGPAGNTPVLTFSPAGTRHRLTGIWNRAAPATRSPARTTSPCWRR